MKKVRSIYFIFIFFCIMIIVSFGILYGFSTSSLQDSLEKVAQIQMEHSFELLNQKIKEIEIEADGILNSEDLKALQIIRSGKYEVYDYVMAVRGMKEYLESRQKSNVGMREFILYWPESKRCVTTGNIASLAEKMLEMAEDNLWFVYQNEVYFSRLYRTGWEENDEEPYLIIEMDRDYLYKITGMASEVGSGGALLIKPDGKSLFPTSGPEEALLKKAQERNSVSFKVRYEGKRYQILKSGLLKNGLETVSYYPIRNMMQPVHRLTRVTGVMLFGLMLVGLFFMLLYYRNILLQLRIITEKLKQVENGDLTARIGELPENEFSYVFEQFNKMIIRIGQLIESIVREQQLRAQAELRQLQLQIHPHFLYNSLSYIVTVADKPRAVTQMAMHLSNYYRYCTVHKSVTTVGEEVSYAKAYLSIMALRRQIEYEIQMPKELEGVGIIPLILQPVIENAIEHGIEERENAKHILVKVAAVPGGRIRFEVSDDGNGLTEEQISSLERTLKEKEHEGQGGIGLWNVNQRLINYYDESAGLEFGRSIWGGLKVIFTIAAGEQKNEGFNCG